MKEFYIYLTEIKKMTLKEIKKLTHDEILQLSEEFINYNFVKKMNIINEFPEHEKKIYAIDFDNTIAYTNYPTIIKPLPYAMEVLKVLTQDPNSILILWTCREGKELKNAVNYCGLYNVKFDYVNENSDELINKYHVDCRKIGADVYIDDKSYQGIKGVEDMWKNWYLWLIENGFIENNIDNLA